MTGRTLRRLIAEVQRDLELAEIWRERFITLVRAQHRVMVDRAVERGEVRPDADPDIVLDLLYGAAYHRLLQSHLPLSNRFAQAVVEIVVAGMGTEVGPGIQKGPECPARLPDGAHRVMERGFRTDKPVASEQEARKESDMAESLCTARAYVTPGRA